MERLENLCLFKIQMDYRVSRDNANIKSKCYICKGDDSKCKDYTPVKPKEEHYVRCGGLGSE